MLYYIFSKVLFLSLSGSVAIVALWLFNRITHGRISYQWNYRIWLIALVILLLPISITMPVKQASAPQALPPLEQTEEKTPTTPISEQEVVKPDEPADTTVATSQAPVDGSKLLLPTIDYQLVLPLLWLLGTMGVLCRGAYHRIRFSRRMKALSIPCSLWQQRLFTYIKTQSGIRTQITLRGFAGNSSPFVTGVWRPVLYLPQGLEDEKELCMVLRHELVHCKRHDLFWKLLLDVVTAIHFFNPMLYLMRRQVDKYCELSCDEAAVSVLDSSMRKDYAKMLLMQAKRTVMAHAGSAALYEKNTNLETRVEGIMNQKKAKKRTVFLCALLAGLLSLSCFAIAAAVNGQNSTQTPRATYSGTVSNVSFYTNDDGSTVSVGDFLNIKDSTAVYTDFLGFTDLRLTFFGMSQETADKMDALAEQGAYNASLAMFDDVANYTDYYELTLDKTVRRFGDGYGMEGLFTLRKNREIVFTGATGYLNNLPPVTPNNPNGGSIDLAVLTSKDGQEYIWTFSFNVLTRDGKQNRQNEARLAAMDKAKDTRVVRLGNCVEATLDATPLSLDGLNKRLEGEEEYRRFLEDITFNASLNLADFNLPFGDRYTLNFHGFEGQTVTADTVSGMFLVYDSEKMIRSEAFEGTISGLSNPAGGFVELRSDDGRYYAKYAIVPVVEEPLKVKGTRQPEEFYQEGEDVFIGTPKEQDEFDKEEHSKFYKRIVVDEDGLVLLVVPVEYQQKPYIDTLPPSAYTVPYTWSSIFDGGGISLVGDPSPYSWIVLKDRATWWIRAIIPPENQFYVSK